MKGKLKFILPVLLLLLVAGGAYKFVLTGGGSGKKAAPPKIEGTLLPLSPDFTINLAGGHYGKVTVALLLSAGAPKSSDASVTPTLEENPAVRSIITDRLTGLSSNDLVQPSDRHQLLAHILKQLQGQTDVKVTRVYFTDVVVQ
jgi:flagellar FliL protein